MCLLAGSKCQCDTRDASPFIIPPQPSSHKVNKTSACMSSPSTWRIQSCVAFWLQQAIRKKEEKKTALNATSGDALKFPLLHCFLTPGGE